ncbi:hypothetical protein NPIL_169561 [Nephila pilipes]|uniref:Transmembrane protein n=1 Tax=Nephila pilipes TaxID=299642 RepID=A0A8X6Q670_NEPPI|nr:hypothetical protein NPIL_423001 [Nephila pilipes]GFU14348.1 hypothetical protein NPIL_169561 [Nephila pilipes]
MSLRNVYEDLALALSCFCMMVLFCSGSYFCALPFIIYAVVNGNWMKKLETKPKKVKPVIPKFPTNSPEPTDLMWYETINISEAPRLENNPFAYAYINNPFCGDDFPRMDPPIKGSFPKNSSLLFIYA